LDYGFENSKKYLEDLKIQKRIWRKFLRQKLLEKVPETKTFGESS